MHVGSGDPGRELQEEAVLEGAVNLIELSEAEERARLR